MLGIVDRLVAIKEDVEGSIIIDVALVVGTITVPHQLVIPDSLHLQ
jgi:hypothetical protein